MQVLELRVGISYIDISHAKANLLAQQGGVDTPFDTVWNQTKSVWNSELGRLSIDPGTSTDEAVRLCA